MSVYDVVSLVAHGNDIVSNDWSSMLILRIGYRKKERTYIFKGAFKCLQTGAYASR